MTWTGRMASVLAALALAGCSAGGVMDDPAAGSRGLALVGASWRVIEVQLGDVDAPAPDGVIATFDTDGTLRLDLGCNTSSATYRISGDLLRVTGDLATTAMGCVDREDFFLLANAFDGMVEGRVDVEVTTVIITEPGVRIELRRL